MSNLPTTSNPNDVEFVEGEQEEGSVVAYYRVHPNMVDFARICQQKHEIVGFQWDFESLNFGFVLKEKQK